MRPIEEIKADIAEEEKKIGDARIKHEKIGVSKHLLGGYKIELVMALTHGIPLDQLETYCKAIRDGRCVVLPCKVTESHS